VSTKRANKNDYQSECKAAKGNNLKHTIYKDPQGQTPLRFSPRQLFYRARIQFQDKSLRALVWFWTLLCLYFLLFHRQLWKRNVSVHKAILISKWVFVFCVSKWVFVFCVSKWVFVFCVSKWVFVFCVSKWVFVFCATKIFIFILTALSCVVSVNRQNRMLKTQTLTFKTYILECRLATSGIKHNNTFPFRQPTSGIVSLLMKVSWWGRNIQSNVNFASVEGKRVIMFKTYSAHLT
jgi:hypothetical protein